MGVELPPRALVDAALAHDDLEMARLHGSLRARLFGDGEAPLVGGRYAIRERIGSGGMGVVYRAHDRELDRDVAVKVVHPQADVAAGSASRLERVRERLRGEARGLARLAHPNVVAVYDVGPTDDGVYIAMELCRGPDLRRWLAEAPRPWRQVLAMLLQAAQGLAAAHAAGVVHRDVKPSNVLVGDDGRVRVLDFGLAKFMGGEGLGSDDDAAASGSSEDSASPRMSTQASAAILGTPPYMAPEQHAGELACALSDQYSFCVTAWEALFGTRPFAGKTLAALDHAKRELAFAPHEHPSNVPAAAEPVLRRGLAIDRDARWPDMLALVDALARASRPSRARLVLGTLAFAGAGLGIAAAIMPAPTQPCTGPDEQFSGVWDDDRRGEVEAAFRATQVPYADATWAWVHAELDRYRDEWSAQHVEACEATSLRREQPGTVLDLRMACLRRAQLELAATVDVLAHADAKLVQRAAVVTGRLPRLSGCADVAALQSEVHGPVDPELARAVELAEAELRSARARVDAGDYEAALAELEAVRESTRALDWDPLHARVLAELGNTRQQHGDYAAAEPELREALAIALRSDALDVAAGAARDLMYLLGYRLQRTDEALELRERVVGLAERTGAMTGLSPAAHGNVGTVLQAAGRYEEAEAELLRAAELSTQVYGARHPMTLLARANRANALKFLARYDEAAAEHRELLAAWERMLGTEHPYVADAHNNLGLVLKEQGRPVESETEHRLALAIRMRSLGPDHPDVASSHNNLGTALAMQDRAAEAEREFRAALELRLRVLGPDHPEIATARMNLSNALSDLQRLDEAEHELRAALEIWERKLGTDHPRVAIARNNLGLLLLDRGDAAGAEAEMRAALAIHLATIGADHPNTARARANLGKILLARGRSAEAFTELRAALVTSETALAHDHPQIADVLVLLDQTRRDLAAAGPASAAVHAEVLRLLARRADQPMGELQQATPP